MNASRRQALAYTLVCVLSWACIPVVSRFGQVSLDHYQFLFWSSILSLGIVALATIIAGKIENLLSYTTKDICVACGLGFLGTFLYYLLLYYGYAHAQGLEVLVLQYTWPMFVVLFSILLLGERVSLRTIIALLLGFLGILLVLSKGEFSSLYLGNIGVDLLVLFAASVFGMFSVLSKKSTLEPFSLTTYFFLSATTASAVAMLLFSTVVVPTGNAWIPIIFNGALINGLSYVLWLLALRHAHASFIAPFVFLTPVIAAFLIVLIFHERLLPVYFLGLGAVVIAGWISK